MHPHLELVELKRGEVIYEYEAPIRFAYFPESAAVSLLSLTQAGNLIEVGVIGYEGIVGAPIVLRVDRAPNRAVTQVAGTAYRADAQWIRNTFDRQGQLQDLLLRHVYQFLVQVSQSAVCNRYHSIEQRFARWLLSMHDRVPADVMSFTHELIANMLGVPRSSVTAIARGLQEAGLIRYRWGQVSIVDRDGLEHRACECYQIVRRVFEMPGLKPARASTGAKSLPD